MSDKAITAAPAFSASGSSMQTKNGKLDYVVVKPTGLQLGTANGPRAVPWAKLKTVTGDKSRPIALSLSDEQLTALPVFGGSKAQETPAHARLARKSARPSRRHLSWGAAAIVSHPSAA